MGSTIAPPPFSSPATARWIWPGSLHWDLVNAYALFRHRFELATVPTAAPLFITADQSYQLYLNGHYIGRGPGRGFQDRWPYDEIDVSPWLRTGSNVIAVRAHNPGCSNYQYRSEGYAGLLVTATWDDVTLASGEDWRCRRQDGVRPDTVSASLQLFRQEHIDLRLEDPDWMQPDFDDSDWNGKVASAAWNAMPWFTLEPRDAARLDEPLEALGHIIGTTSGTNASDYQTARELGHLRHAEGLTHRSATALSEEAAALPNTFAPSGTGHWHSVVLDLGKTHIGATNLEIIGARGGEIVECHHFETCTVSANTITPDFKPDSHGRMTFAHRLICRNGTNHHAFYHPFGARYVVIVVRDNETPLTVRFRLRHTRYPLRANGRFHAVNDPQLDAIWNTCAWTQRVCSLDAYVDTPGREQAQWWGDARVQAWNTFHLDGDARLLRRGIRQIAHQTTPNGITYGHAPTHAHHCILPDFTLIWIITLWDHYWQTGDLKLVRQQRSAIEQALTYFRHWTCPETGLLRYDDRYWLFLDWADIPKNGQPAVYSLWLLHALDRLQELYRVSEETTGANECATWARALRTSLAKLINKEGLLRDGYDSDGRMLTSTSVHSQTLALISDLSPAHTVEMVTQRLLPSAQGDALDVAPPSAYWITYVYTELAARGYGTAVIADIRRRWQPMVAHGTTWETFDPPRGEFSFSHAWSAHPLFHLMQILGGVRQTAPRWSKISLRPDFIGDGVDVTVPTPHGPIQSAWQRDADTFVGQLNLPVGVTATIELPGHPETTVSGTFDYVVKSPGPITR